MRDAVEGRSLGVERMEKGSRERRRSKWFGEGLLKGRVC